MLHKISLLNFPEAKHLTGNKKREAILEIQKTEIEFQVKNYCTIDNESLINIIRQNLKFFNPVIKHNIYNQGFISAWKRNQNVMPENYLE
tara:strand:+ start:917 stop:1186 length:270 start_codon:yes stop_codon:yes gene_type:complete